jgi:hypothetical protein
VTVTEGDEPEVTATESDTPAATAVDAPEVTAAQPTDEAQASADAWDDDGGAALSEPVEVTHGDPPAGPVDDAGRLAPALPFTDAHEPASDLADDDADDDADADIHEGEEGYDENEYEYDAEAPDTAQPTAEYAMPATYEPESDEFTLEDDYDDHGALRVAVIHLGGIANLAPAERNIELQMSDEGLDIVRGGGEILGRLDWDQVKALEVPVPRGRRRMRRGGSTHLVVRTARGDASFEVPEVTAPELQQHLAPIVARHVRGR